MDAINNFFDFILSQFASVDFALLILIDMCAFAVVFLVTLLGCIFSKKVRSHDKRAFLCAVNAFTAVTLAVFLTEYPLGQSIAATAVFWCAGYLLYGFLKLFKVKKDLPAQQAVPEATVTRLSASPRAPRPAAPAPATAVPSAQSAVRLEHALSIADKLLMKNLGRGDRQELEKIKTALTVLKVKGILSAQEGEALNDMFNALLKFMAKYDL